MLDDLEVQYRSSWHRLAEVLAVRHVFGKSLGDRPVEEALDFDEVQHALDWLTVDNREFTTTGDLEGDYECAFKGCPAGIAELKMPHEPTIKGSGVGESAAALVARLTA